MSGKTKHLSLAPTWGPNLTLVASALAVSTAVAQTNGNTTEAVAQLGVIHAQQETETFKADYVASDKFTAPLLDTPQTIQVVPAKVLKEQNTQTLQEILNNVPGITFSSGEGGAGWGDMFTIRGMPGEQSVTVDETRDSQLTTRTDMFNIEQVDIYKGTGSFETGVGAVGGGVNLVSKMPKLDNFNVLSLGLGTDDYRRATFDTNHMITDTIAFRLNAMGHRNDVANRGPVKMKRWGVAPSIAFGLGTPTRLTLSYFQQKDDNIPDFGVPVSRTNGQPMGPFNWDYWGGASNFDMEETKTKRFSAKFEHDFSDRLRLSNQTTWAQTDRYTSFASGGRLVRGQSGGNSNYWGYASNGSEVESFPADNIGYARLANNTNRYRGKIFSNQTNLNIGFNTGAVEHNMVVGMDLYKESYRKRPFSREVPAGRWAIDVTDPQHYYSGPTTIANSTSRAGAEVENIGLYVYDHANLSPNWEIAGGLRYDHYKARWYDAEGNKTGNRQSMSAWSGRLGLIYKPVENGSIYLSYSQAEQPSVAAMATRSGGGEDSSDFSAGKAKTWELGTKWELLNNNLFVTAALFQVEKTNPTDTDEFGTTTQYEGKDRVRGIELSASGNLTDRWSVFTGLSIQKGKIIKDGENPIHEGGKLKNVPETTFNVWTTYAVTEDLNVSLGAQYVGTRQFTRGNEVTRGAWKGKTNKTKAPAYWVSNAAVSYKVNKHVDLRLNAYNLFDKKYLSRVSSSSDSFQLYGVPGAGRSFVLSTDIRF